MPPIRKYYYYWISKVLHGCLRHKLRDVFRPLPMTPDDRCWLRQPDGTRDARGHESISLYGMAFPSPGGAAWQTDPFSGYFFSDADRHDLGMYRGDIRVVWERSCCHHLLVFAAEFRNGKSSRLADILHTIGDWLQYNPPGSVNWWSPMMTSLRLAVWSYAFYLILPACKSGDDTRRRLMNALHEHQLWVLSNLEWGGVRSNHFIGNLTGLYISSALFPELPGSQRLRAWAAGQLEREMRSQVYANGVSHEHSTHYHAFVFEMFLQCWLIAGIQGYHDFTPCFKVSLSRMNHVLERLADGDGRLPQIGDNDSGYVLCVGRRMTGNMRCIGPLLQAAKTGFLNDAMGMPARVLLLLPLGLSPNGLPLDYQQARDLTVTAACQPPPEIYQDCGWCVVSRGELKVIGVCGKPGLKGIGSHDHNHCNELIISAKGSEFIVDPGTGCYTADPAIRNRFRSIGSHSTLQSGEEPSVWKNTLDGLFYIRKTWRHHLYLSPSGTLSMHARYGNVRHEREVDFSDGKLHVFDRHNKEGAFLQWVLHPDVIISRIDSSECLLQRGECKLLMRIDNGTVRRSTGLYSDHFKHVGETRVVECVPIGMSLHTTFEIMA